MGHVPHVLSSLFAIRIFRKPIEVMRCYLMRTCPESLCLETRSGYKVHLTGDPDDVVTAVVVMGRADYGAVPEHGVIIDIGAHLGTFMLYAISKEVGEVYCYEPDPVLYDALLRNVTDNALSGKVKTFQAAVVGRSVGEVVFYQEGNASGHIGFRGGDSEGIRVPARTLSEVIADSGLRRVDLLKMDCEGSEYEIVSDTPAETWMRVRSVRLDEQAQNP